MSTDNPLTGAVQAMFAASAPPPAAPAPVAEAPEPVAETPAEVPTEVPAVEAPVADTPVAEVAAPDPGDEQDEEVDIPAASDPNKAILAALSGEAPQTTKVHKRVVDALPSFGMTVEDLVNFKEFKGQVAKKDADLKARDEELATYARASPELRAAIAKDILGDTSWKKDIVRNGVDFDYTKPAEQQSKKSLVDTFMPGKVTDDQWKEFNDPDGDARDKAFVSTMIELAGEKFTGRAKEVNSSIDQMVQAQKQWVDNWTNSGEAAITATKQRIPAAAIYEPQLRQALSSPNAIMALFEEPGKPGVLRPDAAENLMMAIPEIRKGVLSASFGKEVKKAKDAAELGVLRRSPDKPAPTSASAPKPVAPAAPQSMADMAKQIIGIR